jgi:hypothetical protein
MDGVTDLTREQTEVAILRAFYDAWVAFHKIPNDGPHSSKKKQAAQEIVNTRWAIIRFDRLYGPLSKDA